jgi:molybdopterin-guanine dinucleotide biosynthesis protein A
MTGGRVSVLGSIIAGGASTRYGSPKALACIGDRRVVDRVADALRLALGTDRDDSPDRGPRIVAIVNEPPLAREIGLPSQPDVFAGIGPLAGVHAALLWAAALGRDGVLAVGCDMPFIEPALLREIVARADRFDVVLPSSEGRRGVEPLCAWYATSCIPAIETAVARGDTRVLGFHDASAGASGLRVDRVPLEVVGTFGDPAHMFLNVNTLQDRQEAEQRLREGGP